MATTYLNGGATTSSANSGAGTGIGVTGGSSFYANPPASYAGSGATNTSSFALPTSFIIDEIFWAGMTETLEQNTNIFNEMSGGALRLTTRRLLGNFEREQFIRTATTAGGTFGTDGLLVGRDVTSTAAVTDKFLTMAEQVGVKVNRRIGPIAQTLDMFRKHQITPEEFSFDLGLQWGKEIARDYVDTALGAAVGALGNTTTSLVDLTAAASPTISHLGLISGMQALGDAASRIVCFVMHSKTYFDLMKSSVQEKIYEISGVTIYSGSIATFGKPVIVTDSAALKQGSDYHTLALVDSAIEIAESEAREIAALPQLGLQNIVIRIQGEYAFNVKVKGFAYDMSKGPNPEQAQIASSGYWSPVMLDVKSRAGVVIKSK